MLNTLAKNNPAFYCSECGETHPKWVGQCGSCKTWNSVVRAPQSAAGGGGQALESQTLDSVPAASQERTSTGLGELDRVLGGGLVEGSCILIGGQPGAGKSTLLLQVLCHLAKDNPALYVSGEESPQQIAMRARRLGLPGDSLQLLSSTSIDDTLATAARLRPRILVIDSIQVMRKEGLPSAPGSVPQVREGTAALVQYAKASRTILVIVGHVTKEGHLAGPKVLEHLIDASLMLESGTDSRYRTLRSHKNRFGAVNELGVFAMTGTGMREVKNPSAIFLSRSGGQMPGSIITVLWEGSRPLLVELQALADDSSLASPRRLALGMDGGRLAMLLAVLHRHGGLATGNRDLFINLAGGVRVSDTSGDLPSLLAVASSIHSHPLPEHLVAFGEVGLTGEIRPVIGGQERLQEAAKQGFTHALIPAANKPKTPIKSLKITAAANLAQALATLSLTKPNP